MMNQLFEIISMSSIKYYIFWAGLILSIASFGGSSGEVIWEFGSYFLNKAWRTVETSLAVNSWSDRYDIWERRKLWTVAYPPSILLKTAYIFYDFISSKNRSGEVSDKSP